MGVTGLWTVLQPCARPIRLETLNKKRLAVDASIWIYQFLKAVRDKEGNALRNSHVVGFFRRICKLLYFGIKPVFVFDGDAPALKRQTIAGRKRRREGRREDAVRTAGKLLPRNVEEEEVPDDLVYVDELFMTVQERQQNRRFKKRDTYHLPDLDVSLEEMGAPNDPRIMSHEELQEYAQQFHNGEDISMYDFSKIDFNSPFFQSLPASDRYNILNAARLRSRLRMGYSKDQLDSMFPDRMAFSRFQIERVAERNELTQRLMNINGMNDEEWVGHGARVAGEKGREYVLVKNDGVEGGWVLGVVGGKNEGDRNKPIDIERINEPAKVSEDEEGWEDDGGFEDVPIEGLNRLPKHSHSSSMPLGFKDDYGMVENEDRRKALYESRKRSSDERRHRHRKPKPRDKNPLFFADDEPDEGWEDWDDQEMTDLFEGAIGESEVGDEELNRAIAMSLNTPSPVHEGEDDDLNRAIAMSLEQPETEGISPGKGKGRQSGSLPSSLYADGYGDDSDQDMQATLDESRRIQSQRKSDPSLVGESSKSTQTRNKPSSLAKGDLLGGFLPFEKLDFSRSVLRERGSNSSDEAGGFEKERVEKAVPLPPWFSGGLAAGLQAERNAEEREFSGVDSGKRDRLSHYVQPLAPWGEKKAVQIDTLGDEGGPGVGGVVPVDSKLRLGGTVDITTSAGPPNPEAQEDKSQLAAPEWWEPSGGERQESGEEPFEWEESEGEPGSHGENAASAVRPATHGEASLSTKPSPIFEDAVIPGSQNFESIEELNRGGQVVGSYDQELFEEEVDQFSDPDDEELMRQLAVEAEEHARFASELNQKSKLQNQEDYERELKALRNQQKKDRRDADEVNHIMVTECQQLLKLFGLPYVTAPMEAEAQCAELVRLGLVDGIVTDDSDTFLFGGTRVYKNMFNQAKFVECYLANDLEKEFDLDRRKLIGMAHLLGSDYTDGLPGVGPVTALEILSEFNSEDGLKEFKEWWHRIQIGKPDRDDLKTSFRKKFKRNANKIFLSPTFPDERVDMAYLEPSVDNDPTAFQWGVPDLDALRSFLMSTIGWSQERTDEVLVPVIKDMNRRENEGTQANITSFFSSNTGLGAGAFAPRKREANKGKRMEKAMMSLREQAKRKRSGPDQQRSLSSNSGSEADVTNASRPAVSAESSKRVAPRKKKQPSQVTTKPPTPGSSSSDGYQDASEKTQKRGRGSSSRRGGTKAAT
ncbi:hypothetical protein FGG08_005411 [Glutinoglossum americanum]|uniref:Uncharacterized protein n=1 Tax=Glutinoglossum americanum TaxID=1670608 RepID=A0A9P8L2X6_9PEZI|nr:hypothetical protein FGG08_005411 [Glutinoglossum americanum]